jgi:hypothetical protein
MGNRSEPKINVAYLPAAVAGHPIKLSEAVAKMGFEVRMWQLEDNSFGYGRNDAIFRPGDRFLHREIKRIRSLVQVVKWSDVIHCTFGSTIAGNTNRTFNKNKWAISNIKNILIRHYEDLFLILELKIYQFTKKRLVMDFQGDDIRQRSYQMENYQHSIAHVVNESYYTLEADSRKIKRLELYEKSRFCMHALNPDLLNYLPKEAEFVPYSNIELNPIKSFKRPPTQLPYVFVHAPSNRAVKGTDSIIKVFGELKAEGIPVELKLVEGLKNDEALRIYGQAFMAIDQLNAGWYGGFAVECMAQGVPVIAYIREEDLVFIPNRMKSELPISNACICDLKNEIMRLTEMSSSEYEKLSQKSLDFVHAWHDPQTIASEVIKKYL